MRHKIYFKDIFIKGNSIDVLKILGVFVLLLGVAIGITLVQQNQEYREKAAETCSLPNVCQKYSCSNGFTPTTGACSIADTVCCKPLAGTNCQNNYKGKCVDDNNRCDSQHFGRVDCPAGQICVRQTATCIAPILCPNTDCNIPSNISGAVYCYFSGNKNQTTYCCPPSKPLYDSNKKACVASGGGGGTPTIKPTAKPTKPPTGGGGGGGGNECEGYTTNPGYFTGISKSGELILYVDPGSYQFNISLKKNSETCSADDNDVKLDTKNAVNQKLETGINVEFGDKICVYVSGYDGTPGGGWIEPEGNLCKGQSGTPKDISSLLNLVQEAVSVQCWGDQPVTDCDFNDWALAFAVEEGVPSTEGLSFRIRFQGITKKADDQIIEAFLYNGNSEVWSNKNISIENNSDGVYLLPLGTEIPQGTFNLTIKGSSHLKKRFTNFVYNGGNLMIDFSKEEVHQMRAGDVNNDNTITIEDISTVLSFYTSFTVPVDKNNVKMIASDIDKNGRITIQDVALLAINWSDFKVEGDQ